MSPIPSLELNGFLPYRPSAWVAVEGEDAYEFLQSQFSNDLSQVAAGAGKYGLWLDQKGRVEGDSFILRTGEEEFFLFSATTEEITIIDKLNRYIIADDVELTGRAAEVSAFCLLGNGIEVLEKQGWPTGCPADFEFEGHPLYLLPGRRAKARSIELVFPSKLGGILEETLFGSAAGCERLMAEDVEILRILNQVPAVPLDIGPQELPQEGGLEVEGVSFNKGCYLGQEVMSRLHSMGKARRGLRLVQYDPPVESGRLIYLAGKKVGVAKSMAIFEGKTWGLALLNNTVSAGSELLAGDPEAGSKVKVVS